MKVVSGVSPSIGKTATNQSFRWQTYFSSRLSSLLVPSLTPSSLPFSLSYSLLQLLLRDLRQVDWRGRRKVEKRRDWVENDRSGVVKIEQTDKRSMAKLKHAHATRLFAWKYMDYSCPNTKLPGARNMVIVARNQPHARHGYAGSARSRSTFVARWNSPSAVQSLS